MPLFQAPNEEFRFYGLIFLSLSPFFISLSLNPLAMNLIDFFIGFFLMNAMPHFVLGTWKARMFSAFGFGNQQNIAYSLLNLALSLGLFLYEYGMDGFEEKGIYVGALLVLVIYYLTGNFFYNRFKEKSA